jgi:hypothetical protein
MPPYSACAKKKPSGTSPWVILSCPASDQLDGSRDPYGSRCITGHTDCQLLFPQAAQPGVPRGDGGGLKTFLLD